MKYEVTLKKITENKMEIESDSLEHAKWTIEEMKKRGEIEYDFDTFDLTEKHKYRIHSCLYLNKLELLPKITIDAKSYSEAMETARNYTFSKEALINMLKDCMEEEIKSINASSFNDYYLEVMEAEEI